MVTPQTIAGIPAAPGVYLMKGGTGEVLYVGKARSLRQRVRSYFGSSRDSRYQIRFLMEKVTDLEVIVTDTEKEALILENTLIKRHRPRYNINLRDDKTYFSLRLNLAEQFPRLTIVRKVAKDGADYFGPYASATAARAVLKQLCRIFPLRHYPLKNCMSRRRPCLFYQIRQCSAPCHGLISTEEYQSLAEGAALFLAGKDRELVKSWRRKMAEAAAAQHYEEAARYRDLLRDIDITLERQKVVTQGGDIDVIGLHRDESLLAIALLHIRGGALTGSRNFAFRWELDDAEAIASFLGEYYSGETAVPSEILLPMALPEGGGLEEFLTDRCGRKVTLTVPRRGIKADLVSMAAKNAANAAAESLQRADGQQAVLDELQSRLHLASRPVRIECYDISTFQGKQSVGSRVTFVDGQPFKAGYRRYRIRTVGQADDFAMLAEVLARRAANAEKDPLPDLLIVDGGLGQLGALGAVLSELGIAGIETAALAKSRVRAAPAETDISRSSERVFRPGRKNPIVLRQNSPALLLLARIRDEAHRFAITYHQKLRDRSTLRSLLEDIPGIGRITSLALLRHFGSLAAIREASADELASVPGITRPVAETLVSQLRIVPIVPDQP